MRTVAEHSMYTLTSSNSFAKAGSPTWGHMELSSFIKTSSHVILLLGLINQRPVFAQVSIRLSLIPQDMSQTQNQVKTFQVEMISGIGEKKLADDGLVTSQWIVQDQKQNRKYKVLPLQRK